MGRTPAADRREGSRSMLLGREFRSANRLGFYIHGQGQPEVPVSPPRSQQWVHTHTRHTHSIHTCTWHKHGTHIHNTHIYMVHTHISHGTHTWHTYMWHSHTWHARAWHVCAWNAYMAHVPHIHSAHIHTHTHNMADTHTAHTLDSQATDGPGAAFSHPPRPTHKQTHTINNRLPAPNLGMCSRSLAIPPSTEHRTPCLWKPVGLFDQLPCSLYTRCSSEAGSTLYAAFLLLWDLMLQSECFKITH